MNLLAASIFSVPALYVAPTFTLSFGARRLQQVLLYVPGAADEPVSSALMAFAATLA